MPRWPGWIAILLIFPVALAFTPGCGKSPPAEEGDGGEEVVSGKGKDKGDGGKGGESSGSWTQIGDGKWGSLEGQVTFDGDLFPPDKINFTKDTEVCQMGDTTEHIKQEWIIDPETKGVRDVVVFLKAPAKSYFQVKDEDKKVTEPCVIEQPHCVYIPHAVVHYPSYRDGSKLVPTGQKFVVEGSPKIAHNTSMQGDNLKGNVVAPGRQIPVGGQTEFNLKPQEGPVAVGCDIHPWMRAYAFVLDHPYYAVTDKEGKFKIDNVPAGVEVTVVAWHDNGGSIPDSYVTQAGFSGQAGMKKTFEEGKNELNFKIGKK